MSNIAAITREHLLIVVPFIQDEHYRPGIFGDYWRFMPQGLYRLVESHGFAPVYINANDSPWYPVYLVLVAARHPEQWEGPRQLWDDKHRLARETFVYPRDVW